VSRNRANVALIHDVAKALKHGELTGKSQVKTAAEVAPRPFSFGEGAYGGSPQISIFIAGRKVQLSRALRKTIDFYRSEMNRLCI
jgi:hypothetical protein